MGAAEGGAPGGRERVPGDGAVDDLRTLWVGWDRHGERFKAWRDVVAESTEEELDAKRIEGASTALHMCKAMERQGGDPRMWLERWLREKRVESSDRVSHELRCLTDSLVLAGTVDQLNMGGLHCLETLCRRIAAIVEAYATPGKPSWEHARFYSGVASAEEVVAPSLRSQVVRRLKDEADLHSARSRALQRGGWNEEKTGGDAPGTGGSRGAGRGRGRGGRGDPPPAGG